MSLNKQLDIEAIEKSKSFAELQKHVTLEIMIRALKSVETQRIAHKRYTQKKQLILERAKKLQKEKPELFEGLEQA